ncbi:MAG: class I SAM-dependent methyltransferase [Betaproteobacteria bacterium]|jgi:demethylmenaquinone methyltransferase/2-methoxy-6-polyprenyl-1,4-benzoquinol methylase|nr:class I SAM-dependent methyltransferase [Betaproteobacteria bacterium]MBP6316835.1 class I SAM-dependent methyltransferase [Rubrivivax sp.]MBK7275215.1 class I SAM-dependent methyltransferase [Betaproteobacteria bacterium]MBK7514395.1 class I SAM-dependent methyltransferase [Betaproteobacteria bacterium]MBK8863668.1 class I SAM-dependent methyltransferase [Betaproteobacteria bacterium]
MTRLSRTFGYQSVEENEREQRIRRVFEAVARRYDLMNDLMSMGIHRLWKRTLVRLAAPRAGQLIVDLAGGTGDVAARLAAADRVVAVCDPSVPMMQAGRARGHRHVQWLAGTGENMPLPVGSVDTITIAFGIRNVTRIEDALAEALRVLKPGGRFLCLEFSTPWAPVRPFYNFFSFAVIPRLGAMVAQAPEAYTYLVESIRRFPDQRSFQALMQQAGFGDVSYRNLSLGIACIHVGTKPAPAGKGSR